MCTEPVHPPMDSPQLNTNPNQPLSSTLKALNPYAEPFVLPSCKTPCYPHQFFSQPSPPALPQPQSQPQPPTLVAVGCPAAPEHYKGVWAGPSSSGGIPWHVNPHIVPIIHPMPNHHHPYYYNANFLPQPNYYNPSSSLLYLMDGDDCSTAVGGGDEKSCVGEGVVKKLERVEVKDRPVGRGGTGRRVVVSRRYKLRSQRGRFLDRIEKGCVPFGMPAKCEPDVGVGDFLKSPCDDADADADDDHQGKTTVMIKNIPNKMRKDLLHLLDEFCQRENRKEVTSVRSEYDFVYLPMDFLQRCNLGYAFVNFTSSDAATRVCKYLHNYRWKLYESKKICQIGCARIQGKEALVEHFRRSHFSCHTDDYLPVVLSPPRDGSVPPTPPRIVGNRVAVCTRKP